MSVFTTLSTKSVAFSYFWTNDYKFAHHFNENCLTISISIQNQNSTIAVRFASFSKYKTKIGPVRSDFEDLAPHFDEKSEDRQQSLLSIQYVSTREETLPQWIYAFVLNATGEYALLIINTVQQQL